MPTSCSTSTNPLWRRAVGPALALLAFLALAAASADAAQAPCQCRAPGGRFAELGERLCLRAPDGGWRVAICDMALNNTSWRFSQDACSPVSRADDAAGNPLRIWRGMF